MLKCSRIFCRTKLRDYAREFRGLSRIRMQCVYINEVCIFPTIRDLRNNNGIPLIDEDWPEVRYIEIERKRERERKRNTYVYKRREKESSLRGKRGVSPPKQVGVASRRTTSTATMGVYACLHEILFRHHENFIFGLRYWKLMTECGIRASIGRKLPQLRLFGSSSLSTIVAVVLLVTVVVVVVVVAAGVEYG